MYSQVLHTKPVVVDKDCYSMAFKNYKWRKEDRTQNRENLHFFDGINHFKLIISFILFIYFSSCTFLRSFLVIYTYKMVYMMWIDYRAMITFFFHKFYWVSTVVKYFITQSTEQIKYIISSQYVQKLTRYSSYKI